MDWTACVVSGQLEYLWQCLLWEYLLTDKNTYIFDICRTVHHHSINKNDQRDAAWSIRLHYACNSTLHVSGALCTHHQECIETVHADSCTIVFRYGVRAGRLGDDPK